MADRTILFKASVKTVKTRNKALGISNGSSECIILPIPKKNIEFSKRAKEIRNNITKFKEFLLLNRKDYINVGRLTNKDESSMTDMERDKIDDDAQTFVTTCKSALSNLRGGLEDSKSLSTQVREHRENVVDSIAVYLKGVCGMYSELKAIRVKRVVDGRRISRIRPEESRVKDSTNQVALKEEVCEESGLDLSMEEMQIYERENKTLFDEMTAKVDEIKQIEGTVMEISRLQEIFTDKILLQKQEADLIQDLAVLTTEDIKDGVKEIRKAGQTHSGFRRWLIFVLLVLSATLLFLDWYN